MKQSYIGSYRKADHREHHDRRYGRGAAQDFIVRMEDGLVESVVPELTEEVKMAILKAINYLPEKNPPIPMTVRFKDFTVRITDVLTKK